LAVALCVTVKVKAFSKETIDFALVWNMPIIYFTAEPELKYKRYNNFNITEKKMIYI